MVLLNHACMYVCLLWPLPQLWKAPETEMYLARFTAVLLTCWKEVKQMSTKVSHLQVCFSKVEMSLICIMKEDSCIFKQSKYYSYLKVSYCPDRSALNMEAQSVSFPFLDLSFSFADSKAAPGGTCLPLWQLWGLDSHFFREKIYILNHMQFYFLYRFLLLLWNIFHVSCPHSWNEFAFCIYILYL